MSVAAGTYDEAHPSTGWSNQKFGLVIFIASEAIIFGALFAHYFYNRISSSAWPPPPAHDRVPVFPLAIILFFFIGAMRRSRGPQIVTTRRGRDVIAGGLGGLGGYGMGHDWGRRGGGFGGGFGGGGGGGGFSGGGGGGFDGGGASGNW